MASVWNGRVEGSAFPRADSGLRRMDFVGRFSMAFKK